MWKELKQYEAEPDISYNINPSSRSPNIITISQFYAVCEFILSLFYETLHNISHYTQPKLDMSVTVSNIA